MKKRVAVCAALGILVMHGGSAFAGSDYPIGGDGGGDPQCEAAEVSTGGGTTGAGGAADGCWTPPADPGDPGDSLPGDPAPGISARNPSPQQSLPATGGDNGDLLRLGGVTVAAGLGLVVVTRRRGHSAA